MKKEDIEKVFDENSTAEDHVIALTQMIKGFCFLLTNSLSDIEKEIAIIKKAIKETMNMTKCKSAREIEDYMDNSEYGETKVKVSSYKMNESNKDKILDEIVSQIRAAIKGKTVGEIEKEINKKKN